MGFINIIRLASVVAILATLSISVAAQAPRCGLSALHTELQKRGYVVRKGEQKSVALKATATEEYVIPVVFHVALTASQLSFLGGEAMLKRYIDSQVVIINRDFAAANKDTSTIPAPFKPFLGNARIRFALARTAPGGDASDGYEYLQTSRQGYELSGYAGSNIGFSTAKYKSSGGIDAWDPSVYLNIWVINPLDGGSATNILGLTLPPSFIDYYNIPEVEMGIMLAYRGWGNNINSVRGRTLTHEIGHYFELRHVWGDDDGKCPSTGGEDDGIGDTPPQSNPTYGCPAFPKFDACTNLGTGIMFMNFMDYTDDNCQRMFTNGQVNLMRNNLLVFGNSHRLTQHPEVLDYPSSAPRNVYTIYPNPSPGRINLRFNRTPEGLEYIHVIDAFGRSIQRMDKPEQRGFYMLELNNISSGLYFVQLKFTDRLITEKVVIARD